MTANRSSWQDAEVARRFAARVDRPIEIAFTGLRAGEKLHEVLFGEGESSTRRVHPLISHISVPPLEEQPLLRLDPHAEPEMLVESLRLAQMAGVESPRLTSTRPTA